MSTVPQTTVLRSIRQFDDHRKLNLGSKDVYRPETEESY